MVFYVGTEQLKLISTVVASHASSFTTVFTSPLLDMRIFCPLNKGYKPVKCGIYK